MSAQLIEPKGSFPPADQAAALRALVAKRPASVMGGDPLEPTGAGRSDGQAFLRPSALLVWVARHTGPQTRAALERAVMATYATAAAGLPVAPSLGRIDAGAARSARIEPRDALVIVADSCDGIASVLEIARHAAHEAARHGVRGGIIGDAARVVPRIAVAALPSRAERASQMSASLHGLAGAAERLTDEPVRPLGVLRPGPRWRGQFVSSSGSALHEFLRTWARAACAIPGTVPYSIPEAMHSVRSMTQCHSD